MKVIFRLIKKIIYLSLITTLIIGAIGVYATFIERNLLVVKKHNVTINENGSRYLKIVQFSDTQLGEYYSLDDLERAVNKINKQNADIVVFTGDLIDNASKYDELDNISEVLSKIKANVGKYAIYGNHDYGGGAVRYYENIMSEAEFTVLNNSSTSLELNEKKINIFGGDDALMGKHNAKLTVNGITEDSINILLIHEPDIIEEYSNYPIDFALSGHSHGGQAYIPFYGPIKKNLLSEKYNRGFYTLDNDRSTKLYVNTGLGNTKVPFRFLTIPEITMFTLRI